MNDVKAERGQRHSHRAVVAERGTPLDAHEKNGHHGGDGKQQQPFFIRWKAEQGHFKGGKDDPQRIAKGVVRKMVHLVQNWKQQQQRGAGQAQDERADHRPPVKKSSPLIQINAARKPGKKAIMAQLLATPRP